MIGYIRGELAEILETTIVIDCCGVGYEVMIPDTLRHRLPPVGTELKVYTYQYVKEDALDLYGFLSRDDLTVFKLLLTVSGIGPKGALSILSALPADELRIAVLSGDAKAVQKAPGIGGKTAQRLIIDLKDKFKLEDVLYHDAFPSVPAAGTGAQNAREEAIEALTALGYSPSEAVRAVNSTDIREDTDSETILKAALKQLAFL